MADRPMTVDETAEHFSVTARKLRELVRKHSPRALRLGRDLLFDAQAIQDLTEAMRCHSQYANAGKSGTRVVRSMSARKPSTSPNSAQERVRERLRSLSPEIAKPQYAGKSLKATSAGKPV